MTSNTDKLRAVFLTALMIGSIFAAGIAFTGSAAAVAAVDSGHISDTSDVASGEDASYSEISFNVTEVSNSDQDVELDIGLTNGAEFTSLNNVAVEANGTATASVDQSGEVANNGNITAQVQTDTADATINVTLEGVDVQYPEVSTNTDVDFIVTATDTGDSSTATGTIGTITVTEGDAPQPRKATHYVDSDDGAIIEIAYDEGVDLDSPDADIGLSNGTVIDVTDVADFSTNNGRLAINTSNTVYNNVQNVSVSGVDDQYGNEVSDDAVDVRFAATTVNTTADGTTFEGFTGSLIALEGNLGNSYDIDGPNTDLTRGAGTNSEVYVLDTEGFETGDYNITNRATEDEVVLELSDLGLEVSPDEDSFTTEQAVTATVESDSINRDITAELVDSSGDTVETLEARIDSDGSAALDFGTEDAGNYTIVVTDDNTGVTAETDEFEVVEAAAGNALFTEPQPEITQGDVVEIPIELTGTTQASVVLGSDDVNYIAEVNVTDGNGDGEVVLQWNTYTAGRAGASFTVADTPDGEDSDTLDVHSETDLGSLIADGSYDIEITTGHGNFGGDATDLGTVYVNPRTAEDTGPQTIWTAPGTLDIGDVLDSEDLTQDDSIAALYEDRPDDGDYVVHEIEASGVYGLIANESDGLEGAIESNALNLTVEQTESSTGPNQDPAVLQVNDAIDNDVVALQADADNSTIYVVVDVDAAEEGDYFERNGSPVDIKNGWEFNATFAVTDSSGLVDETQTASAEYTVVDAVTEFTYEGDHVTVSNADGQEVTGESTLAAGTEFTVRVQSTETPGEGFIRQDQEVVVQDDGTWTAELNFSDTAVNSSFDISVRHSGTAVATATGEVVEAEQQPTDTTQAPTDTTQAPTDTTQAPTDTTAEPTDTTAEPTDTTAAPTDTTEDGGTDGGIPGFGMGIALVAVLGAALLALRRDN